VGLVVSNEEITDLLEERYHRQQEPVERDNVTSSNYNVMKSPTSLY
jgi:hypothetical protein